MNNQNLLIYEFNELFKLLDEIKKEININIIKISKNDLNEISKIYGKNFIIITKKKLPNISNQFLLNELPIQISKFIEKINIKFLKMNFNKQSEVIVGKYLIDINSREMKVDNIALKLTEKECDIIIHLFNSKKPVPISELQTNVWDYNSKLETHTVETHIYRLRKKIFDKFKDNNFIFSKKDGYSIS